MQDFKAKKKDQVNCWVVKKSNWPQTSIVFTNSRTALHKGGQALELAAMCF